MSKKKLKLETRGMYSPSSLAEASRKARIMRGWGWPRHLITNVLKYLVDHPGKNHNRRWKKIAKEIGAGDRP